MKCAIVCCLFIMVSLNICAQSIDVHLFYVREGSNGAFLDDSVRMQAVDTSITSNTTILSLDSNSNLNEKIFFTTSHHMLHNGNVITTTYFNDTLIFFKEEESGKVIFQGNIKPNYALKSERNFTVDPVSLDTTYSYDFIKDGVWKENIDTTYSQNGPYVNGKKAGKWKVFHKKYGIYIATKTYSDGELLDSTCYNLLPLSINDVREILRNQKSRFYLNDNFSNFIAFRNNKDSTINNKIWKYWMYLEFIDNNTIKARLSNRQLLEGKLIKTDDEFYLEFGTWRAKLVFVSKYLIILDCIYDKK